MSADREAEVMSQLERARARLVATGELDALGSEGRTPPRSAVFRKASADIHTAEQARNRLLVELVGDADTVPLGLAERLGLTGREAVHILDTARGGTKLMREHVLGRLWAVEER